ncbi:MAG: PAS domain-containing protein [Microgenomates group bacterium]
MDKNNTLEEERKLALHYIVPVVEIARESFLILDSDLKVLEATPFFYKTFKVTIEETVNKFLYDLGNKQWDIPRLRKLLEEILPEQKLVNDYEVEHNFPEIGQKTMLLNARQIDSLQLIVLVIEDITEKKELENKLKQYTQNLEEKVTERTKEIHSQMKDTEKMNSFMVNREVKMAELKQENKKLKESNE